MFSQCLLITAVVAVANVRLAVGEDCKAQLHTFTTCDKDEVTARTEGAHNEANLQGIQGKIDECYKAQSCSPPNWAGEVDADLNPKEKILWKNVTNDWWDTLDNAKRHCVIAEVRGDFGEKLQECVAAKIPGFTIDIPSQDRFSLDDNQKARLRKLAERRLRLEVADSKCDGGKKFKELRECRKKAYEGSSKEACDIRKKCVDPISADCQKVWVEKIRQPICTCVGQVASDLKKAVTEGNQKGDDQVKAKCGVELPQLNVEEVKSDVDLHARVKQFVAFHEDRIISFCHPCEGLNM